MKGITVGDLKKQLAAFPDEIEICVLERSYGENQLHVPVLEPGYISPAGVGVLKLLVDEPDEYPDVPDVTGWAPAVLIPVSVD